MEDDVLESGTLTGIDLPDSTVRALSTTGVPHELRLPDWPGPTLFHSELGAKAGAGRLVHTSEPGAIVARSGTNAGYIIGSVRSTALSSDEDGASLDASAPDAGGHSAATSASTSPNGTSKANGSPSSSGGGARNISGALDVAGSSTSDSRVNSLAAEEDPSGEIYSVFVLKNQTGEVYLLDAARPEDDRFVNASLDAFLTSLEAFHTGFEHFIIDAPERATMVASFRALLEKIDPRALNDRENYWPGWFNELE